MLFYSSSSSISSSTQTPIRGAVKVKVFNTVCKVEAFHSSFAYSHIVFLELRLNFPLQTGLSLPRSLPHVRAAGDDQFRRYRTTNCGGRLCNVMEAGNFYPIISS